MARKSIYTKEMILDSAIKIFKREGSEAITAKNIAKELNCSVAPIYSIYISLDDLKKDLSKCIEECLLNEEPKKEGECKEMDCLLARMFQKLELNTENNSELANKIKELKKDLIKGEDRKNIFGHFTDIISFLSISREAKFSRSQILGLIVKHKKYITELNQKKK
ncbi:MULTISPECIES: TetR/AcrR family transcriptional regulator [Fusobacterium]|uniref:TetR/AcrR family transcriptional regulator n=1 Tax=Fusobacterium TaxID=848 RepID=UPI0025C12114|nr:TetR/AcrR family transcriptional regulator [Fusobacterium sp.]MCI7222801.1 TetR/AcrR family transcriptional regulator [Fusobacterium sp.]MDD7410275.1 TetR/AcrR family transcriptional regulator [Fusobacteriaceae bacterium]MDY5713924.1 TetR/AcrR family transcriptional regulator [Fusobacterium gastrosuis]